MLSRVASNLYWTGRYIERAENLARYSKEIYFSSLDAPILAAYDRKFVLESMLYMAGIFDMEDINERDVLMKIAFERENSNSIFSIITMARENARGARNEISVEMWESINKYYHFVNNYSVDKYVTTGFYDFTQTVLEESYIVRGKIFGTLLHDEVWSVVLLGMYIERVIQMIRIINSKLHDIYRIEQGGHPITEMSFEWTTLLRCTESFDMNRKYYRSTPGKKHVLEFLFLNEACPRSLYHCLEAIQKYVDYLSDGAVETPESISFKIGKIRSQFKYMVYDDYKDDVYGLLNHTQDRIMEISKEIEKKYLSF